MKQNINQKIDDYFNLHLYETNNHSTHFQSSFSHQCKIQTLFHLFDKTKKINKKYGRKRKGKPFQRKHEHECMEEHKLDKRTNFVIDKSFFLLTIVTSSCVPKLFDRFKSESKVKTTEE
jgi:hypothetical protein